MIEVRHRALDDTIVLEIAGEICVATIPAVSSCIDALLDSDARTVVVDLSEVTIFGATAANALIEAARHLRAADRSLTIRGARGLTAQVLDLAGLAPLLETEPQLEIGGR